MCIRRRRAVHYPGTRTSAHESGRRVEVTRADALGVVRERELARRKTCQSGRGRGLGMTHVRFHSVALEAVRCKRQADQLRCLKGLQKGMSRPPPLRTMQCEGDDAP